MILGNRLLRARLRYFDLDRRRPGLPQDVAALVEKLEAERTVLQLVNLSAIQTRNLPGRIRFGYPGNPDAIGSDTPTFPSVLIIWRPHL